MEEIVKMSNKGQLVVPREIRENQSLSPSDRFVAIGVKEGVLFKKVKIPPEDPDEVFLTISLVVSTPPPNATGLVVFVVIVVFVFYCFV